MIFLSYEGQLNLLKDSILQRMNRDRKEHKFHLWVVNTCKTYFNK